MKGVNTLPRRHLKSAGILSHIEDQRMITFLLMQGISCNTVSILLGTFDSSLSIIIKVAAIRLLRTGRRQGIRKRIIKYLS
jgi:hypothetical protein